MPDLPGGSSALPILYQTICVTTGARWSGMTTTSMPLSSMKSLTSLSLGLSAAEATLESASAKVNSAAATHRCLVQQTASAMLVMSGSQEVGGVAGVQGSLPFGQMNCSSSLAKAAELRRF